MEITDSEYEAIIREVTARVKDIIFMNAERYIRQSMTKRRIEAWLDEDSNVEIVIRYVVHLCVGDLQQILGRLRRGDDNEADYRQS